MKKRIILLGSIIILFIVSCDVFDKENLTAISPNDVWSVPEVAEAYVNDIHASYMPGLGTFEGINTDEAMGSLNSSGLGSLLEGTTISGDNANYGYSAIRRINIFLDGIEESEYEVDLKNRLKGEMLFWRAWAYFGMVKIHGGVPLILTVESPINNDEAIFVPRNKTSECFTQILKDLNDAISILGEPQGNGRIDKGVAMAFKGRVALYQASPQFNRSNNNSLWQAAYDANKAAVTYLDGQGNGLYPDFNNIWHDEMNKEVIMVKRYAAPENTNGYSQVCMQPLKYAESGCASANMPSLELVDAFPMKDGSKWDSGAQDYIAVFENRDDRFYATIAYNGAAPYLLAMHDREENLWSYWYDSDGDASTGINGKELRADAINSYEARSSFYPKKMLDRDIDVQTKLDGQVDWIEIRYAEVILNLAEAANETNKDSEALEILGDIRERAGIESGAGNKFGITATSKDEIRQAIKDERFVELAFENKRFSDLRRWREYTTTMTGLENSIKHGLRWEWDGTAADRPTGLEDITTIINQFSVSVIEDVRPITMLDEDKYSFFGISEGVLNQNSQIEQNNTWGGTFDPLQ